MKSLLEDGTKKINEKIFEEALELIEASLEDNEAKKKKYRFLSYGDAMLIL